MTTSYDELRQRIIDGDDTITAAQLDKARRDDEFEQVQKEAIEAAAARTAQEQRLAEIEALHARAATAENSGISEMQAAYRTALEALRVLRRGIQAHNAEASDIGRQARRLNVDGVETPRPFDLDLELERIVGQARIDEPHRPLISHPLMFSRLLDEEYVRESTEWQAEQQRRAAEQDALRRAELDRKRVEHEQQQRVMDQQRRTLGLG